MKRIKLLWTFVFWLFVNTTAMSAIINHDISTASLTIPGTSTDNYVITGSTTTNYVDVETGYQGTITLKNCTIELTVVAHSCIRIHGQNNQSNLFPLTNVKIVLDGNNRLYQSGHSYNGFTITSTGWAALQVDQGAQINIRTINPYDNTSGVLEAIVGTEYGGAAIGALATNANEARGTAALSCGGSGSTAGGNIIISSGTITAKGGHGAGIGGGFGTYYDGMIVIYGGIIDSRARIHAAGIGSGCPTGTGVATCFTPNSAIIVLPPAEITAFGAIGSGSSVASLALAGANNIVYIGDTAKPQVTVHTEDFEPNANIYVDLSMNASIASVVTAVIPTNELDINKVKFGQTDLSGLYVFHGILNDNTTFFTNANSSQPATLGRPYLPEMVTLPSGGTVVLKLFGTDLSLLPSPSIPLIEGFSTLDAFSNAYKVRLIYNDDNNMTNVVFDLANGAASYFWAMRFFTPNGTEITTPNNLVKGDTLDIIIPIKDMSRASSYSDVLRISGEVLGVSIGYIRHIVSQVVIKSLSETACDSFFFKNEYHTQAGVYLDTLQSTLGLDSIVMLSLIIYPTFNDTIYIPICDNDSVLFGGKYYFAQGIYTDSLKTVFGCDSLSTLNSIVKPSYHTNIYDTIYLGERYIDANFDTIPTWAGCISYPRNFNNCDSIITLNLTVNLKLYDTICLGDRYQNAGFDTVPTHAGFISYSHKTGCYISTLNLTIKPSYYDTINVAICLDESYNNYGFNIIPTLPGFFTHTQTHQATNFCDSTIILQLTVNPIYNVYITDTIYEDEFYTVGSNKYNTPGLHIAHLQSHDGCDSVVNLNLHMINYPPEITAFSPFNYDGVNDYFMPGFNVQVFNQYGALIYETKTEEQQKLGWDGKNTSGKNVEPGLYFYILYNSTNKPIIKSSIEVLK